MALRGLLLWLLASGCVTSQALPAMTVLPQSLSESDPSIRWYDVVAGSRAQLRAALDRLGPLDAKGERHDAYTEWLVTWHSPYVDLAEGCKVGEVTTSVRVMVTLPRWRATRETDVELVEQWRDYLDALWLHENGHRENGAKAAAEIEAVLPTLPANASCADAEAAANEVAKKIVRRYLDADQQYDQETHHGSMQGASFPASLL